MRGVRGSGGKAAEEGKTRRNSRREDCGGGREAGQERREGGREERKIERDHVTRLI